MYQIKILIYLIILLIPSCSFESKYGAREKKVEEIRIGRNLSPSEIIRNPLGESGLDTNNIAKIKFNETTIDFGTVIEGSIIEKSFSFKNLGNNTLYLLDAFGTCGCTIPEWPKEQINPGGSGVVKVKFNTAGKENIQKKAITIVTNSLPSETILYLEGIIQRKTKK